MKQPRTVTCSVVIATLDRVPSLCTVLDCLARQTRPPVEVIIGAAGPVEPIAAALRERESPFPLRLIVCENKSAAQQRNAAVAEAQGDVVAFLDDDIEFAPPLLADILRHFDVLPADAVSAISARTSGQDRPAPGRLTRWYYRLQAGYRDATYGGRLFGPAINCYPVYTSADGPLVPSEWLPATCLFVRREFLPPRPFPAFSGYSYAEDVHLTVRLARRAPLFFAADCPVLHHSLPSEFKRDAAELTAGKLRNMQVIARELLGLRGLRLHARMFLHRVFLTAALLMRRSPGAWSELRGVWTLV